MSLAPSSPSADLDQVEDRLIARFCPPLRPEHVQRQLHETMCSFADAPVQTYLAVLVERTVVQRLEGLVEASAGAR